MRLFPVPKRRMLLPQNPLASRRLLRSRQSPDQPAIKRPQPGLQSHQAPPPKRLSPGSRGSRRNRPRLLHPWAAAASPRKPAAQCNRPSSTPWAGLTWPVRPCPSIPLYEVGRRARAKPQPTRQATAPRNPRTNPLKVSTRKSLFLRTSDRIECEFGSAVVNLDDVALAHLLLQERVGKRIRKPLLDDPLQRPRAERRLEALLR
jgi:hypothetical protein